MKRFTTFLVFALALLLSIPTQARLWSLAELTPPEFVSTSGLLPSKQFTKAQQFKQKTLQGFAGVKKTRTTNKAKAPRRALGLVTPPANVEPVTYYTVSGTFVIQQQDYTSQMPSIQVIVDGSDIYIAGLAYYAPNAWIKGTISGNTATFASKQQVDDDATYPEWISGSDSGSSYSENIVFTFDQEAGTLTSQTMYIIEAAKEDVVSFYGYWIQPSFSKTKPAGPEAVVAPEGAEFKEYILSGTDYSSNPFSGTAYIAIVGNDVYLKGYSSYLSEALIKGVKDGNTVTFPAQQWLGKYSGYDSYFMPTQADGTDAVFTYDAEADTYTATGDVFSLLGGQYIDVWVTNPVLKGVVEKATVPANPSISSVENSSYGMVVVFNVPNVDVNGDGLVASKLSYQFFIDVEKEVSALTFTPATHSYLTENLSIIPFGFTENYDFYSGRIYLNDLYSTSWNKIGIKSIYTGGGVTNETEIQWYTIKGYAAELLDAEIATAEALVANTQYKAGQNVLNAAINAAKEVLNNAEATAADKNAALNTLKAAENEFKAANTAYGKLVTEIAIAEALKTGDLTIGLTVFNDAIASAQAVIDKAADATSAQINEAIAALQQAEADFKAANGFVTVAWDATKQGYDNQQVIESAKINDDLTLTLARNEGTNAPAYYTSGTSIRVYDKNTITITGGEKVGKITKIVITQSGSNYGSQLKANVGELTKSGSTLTWVGDAKEVVFTNDKGEASSSVQTRFRTLAIDYLKNLSELMKEAKNLASDADAVAVGKLLDAIAAAEAGDESGLQAAIDQFKEDNKDQVADQTAKVATNGWKNFNGGAAGVCATQFAPAIDTYDGRTNVQLAEVYEGSAEGVNRTGTIIYQDITGLTNGKYKVGFYANAFFTSGRGFESPMADGAEDVAYVFANEQKEFIVANIATSTTENNFRSFDVEVTDGAIKLGLGKEKPGTNWHTMQIYQLSWFTTAKAVYASLKKDMTAAIAAAKALKTANRTEGVADFETALAAAETALASNKLNITEFEAEIAKIKAATETFKEANYFIDLATGTYYIIDAESGLMMAAGNDYGTRAIVNETGLDLTITPNAETRKVTIDTRVANGANHFLGTNLYMDAAVAEWALEYQGFGFYITNGTQYINIDENKNLVMSDTPREFIIVTAEGVKEQRMEELVKATAENGVDATFLLQSPNFNRNDQRTSAWTVVATNSNLNGGNQVNNCAESYHSNGGFTISQLVEGAPAGKYTLTAQGFYRQDDGVEETAPVFFANASTAAVPVKTGDENSMSAASESFSKGLYTIEPIEFEVGEDGQLTVGVKTEGEHQWVIFDNFVLTYFGKKTAPEPEFTTLVSWEKGETADAEGTWTAIGAEGKLAVIGYTSKYNKNTTSVSTISFPNSIVSGGEWQCALKLTGDFKAGDVITIQPFTQMSESDLAGGNKWATILLYNSEKKQIANLTGATNAASKAVTDGHEEEGEPQEFTYTLENDYSELYFGRGGNTRINLMKVNVKRAGGSEPEPQPELKDYTYGFPQSLNGWTTIDADDDGYAWELQISKTNPGIDGVPGLVSSASYAAQTALTPDNYLVSPKLKLDGKITFYAFAQDASYPAEHFGVAVSTASGTQAADFTMVSEEWEMAASRRALPENAPRRVQGNAYFYEVDLSQFAGQEGYVAIRHYNCTDMFRLNVDNITLTTSKLIDAYDPDLEVVPEQPTIVVLPEGAKVEEYSMAYENSDGLTAAKPVNVAVVDNTVYFQGLSNYLPEAWVKGKLENGIVTFAANQFMGEYGSNGESYFFYTGSVNTFAYNAEADTYTATGEVFGVLADQYYDGLYINPVLSKVTEVAGTPATPSISEIATTQFGDVMVFNVPVFDTNGNAMVTSKLSYQFFIDDENTPMVFTPDYYKKLTESLTVIPYGFTENYDFYDDQIYLNMPHDTWKKIGIQSIYTGGGETNKSEISWFKMPEPPVTPPAGLTTEAYSFKANAKEYSLNDDSEFEPYTSLVQVGFAGDDVYIQGLATDAPELWVKATKNSAGKYVIPANQFMGNLEFWGYTFPYYWTAVDEQGNCVDAVLDFNAETSTFTTAQTLALNESESELDYFILYNNVEISKFVEVAATPADPTFEAFNISDEVGYSTIYASVPIVGTEGEVLNPEKLFYIVWIEKNGEAKKYTFTAALYADDFEADVVEVPYNHDGYDIYKGGEIIYLEDELEELNSWTKVGIQSVYYGKNERHESNIVWSNDTKTPTGISTVAAEKAAPAAIYNLNGQKVEKTRKGLYIVNGKKVVVK